MAIEDFQSGQVGMFPGGEGKIVDIVDFMVSNSSNDHAGLYVSLIGGRGRLDGVHKNARLELG